MHEIADVTKTVDTQKVAVLARWRLRMNSTACSGTSAIMMSCCASRPSAA